MSHTDKEIKGKSQTHVYKEIKDKEAKQSPSPTYQMKMGVPGGHVHFSLRLFYIRSRRFRCILLQNNNL